MYRTRATQTTPTENRMNPLSCAVQDGAILPQGAYRMLAVQGYRMGAKGEPPSSLFLIVIDDVTVIFNRSEQGEERARRHAGDGPAAKSECDPCKCKRLAS